MNYNKTMKSANKLKWKKAVDEEHVCMVNKKLWRAISSKNIHADAKILSSTWAMKMKSNGVFRARLVAHGFELQEGEHYLSEFISSPVHVIGEHGLLGVRCEWRPFTWFM